MLWNWFDWSMHKKSMYENFINERVLNVEWTMTLGFFLFWSEHILVIDITTRACVLLCLYPNKSIGSTLRNRILCHFPRNGNGIHNQYPSFLFFLLFYITLHFLYEMRRRVFCFLYFLCRWSVQRFHSISPSTFAQVKHSQVIKVR